MRKTPFVVGVIIILLGISLMFNQAAILNLIFPFIEQTLTATIQLTDEAKRLFSLILSVLAITFLIIGIVGIGWSKPKIRDTLTQTFLTDEICKDIPLMPRPKTILILSAVIGIIFAAGYSIQHLFNLEYLYLEDGFFESLTAINYLGASFLIAATIWSIKKMDNLWRKKEIKLLITTFVFILLFFFVIGMEEISWGQRILGWETPAVLESINYNGETNIHNIFNPLFRNLYRFFGLFFIIIIINGWLFVRRWHPFFYHIIFPHPSIIFLAYLVSFAGLINLGELFEELFSLFCLFYAIRVFMCFRSEEPITELLPE